MVRPVASVIQMLRVWESFVQDKVKTTNQMHAFLLEFGISVPRGPTIISRLSTILEDNNLPCISISYCIDHSNITIIFLSK
jgi:hypothetical protein